MKVMVQGAMVAVEDEVGVRVGCGVEVVGRVVDEAVGNEVGVYVAGGEVAAGVSVTVEVAPKEAVAVGVEVEVDVDDGLGLGVPVVQVNCTSSWMSSTHQPSAPIEPSVRSRNLNVRFRPANEVRSTCTGKYWPAVLAPHPYTEKPSSSHIRL